MSKYEEVVNLALRRGLFFPASEIYQTAPAGFYDFGPYGASIKRKIVEQWRKHFVQAAGYLEMDGAILMPEDVFRASGHLESFNDPMTQCKKCHTIHRADKMLEELGEEVNEGTAVEELTKILRKHKLVCPKCKGELMDVKQFNLMMPVTIGLGGRAPSYLRGETCQSIFTAWDRIKRTMRIKLPQGISQYGKAYRNEISPRQTLIRQVEFTQMETEVFFDPDKINEVEDWDDVKDYKVRIKRVGKEIEGKKAQELVDEKIVSGKIIAYNLAKVQQLYERYGIPLEKMRFRETDDDERAFYAKEGWDFEIEISIGWTEVGPINYRTDYDLSRHSEVSGKDLSYLDAEGKKFIPHVCEISLGVDRTFLVVLETAYKKEDERAWLELPPAIAPLHAGVFPLLKNKPELVKKAKEIYDDLRDCYEVFYDQAGSVGKRYARMDEVGVPWCITIDFDSLDNDDVTIRDRDSTKQKRIKTSELRNVLYKLITGEMVIK